MRILLVEDRKIAADQFCRTFGEAGISVETATSLEEGLAYSAGVSGADILVLSLPVEKGTALELVSAIRAHGADIGILVLQEMRNSEEAADLLDAGADDVIAKPVHQRPLVSRLRALIRRQAGYATPEIVIGELRYYFDGRRPTVEGNPVSLTSRERSLLECLVMKAGRTVTREAIYANLYGTDGGDVDPKIIDVYICKLRKKLGPVAAAYIDTAFGMGYRIEAPGDKRPEPVQAPLAARG